MNEHIFSRDPYPELVIETFSQRMYFAFFFQTDRYNGHTHNDLKGVCFKKDIFFHTLYWKGAGA